MLEYNPFCRTAFRWCACGSAPDQRVHTLHSDGQLVLHRGRPAATRSSLRPRGIPARSSSGSTRGAQRRCAPPPRRADHTQAPAIVLQRAAAQASGLPIGPVSARPGFASHVIGTSHRSTSGTGPRPTAAGSSVPQCPHRPGPGVPHVPAVPISPKMCRASRARN
jgi:hypothetical protein